MEQNQFSYNGDVTQSQSTPLFASPEGFVQVYVQSLFMGSHNIPSVVFLHTCDTSSTTPTSSSPSTSHTSLSSDVADVSNNTLRNTGASGSDENTRDYVSGVRAHDASLQDVSLQDVSLQDVSAHLQNASFQNASLQHMVLPIEVGTHEIHSIAYYLSCEQQGGTSTTRAQNTSVQQSASDKSFAHASEHTTDGAPVSAPAEAHARVSEHAVNSEPAYTAHNISDSETESAERLTPYTICRDTLQALGAKFARFMIYEVDGARFFAGGVLEHMDTTGGDITTHMSPSITRVQPASLREPEHSFTPQWVETRVTDALILSRMLNVPLFVSREVFLRAGTQADTSSTSQ